jgi:hypothetical protein
MRMTTLMYTGSMRPCPRIRKAVKWGGAAASVVLLAVWLTSVWLCAIYRHPNSNWIGISSGRLNIFRLDPRARILIRRQLLGWEISRHKEELFWTAHRWNDGLQELVLIPLWILIGPVVLPTTIAWRLDIIARRRPLVDHCATCKYDRLGLPAGSVCPECGTAGGRSIPHPR